MYMYIEYTEHARRYMESEIPRKLTQLAIPIPLIVQH